MKTVLLLSGGIDSAALAYWMRPDAAITINYGQLAAEAEMRAAAQISKELGLPHEVVAIDCSAIGRGCMAFDNSCVGLRFPTTPEWWPFRNQLLVTLAAAKAILLGAEVIAIGSVRGDQRHKDGTPEFVAKMSGLLEMQEGSLKLVAPALSITSVDLVLRSRIPASLLSWTHSCHVSSVSCGICPGCIKNGQIWDALSKFPTFLQL